MTASLLAVAAIGKGELEPIGQLATMFTTFAQLIRSASARQALYIALMLALGLCSASSNAASDTMYAVGVSLNESGGDDALLYRVDPLSHSLLQVLSLGGDPAFVLVDLERSVIAVPTPSIELKQVSIVDTRAPLSLRRTPLTYRPGGSPYAEVEVEATSSEIYLAFELGHLTTSGLVPEDNLTGVDLRNGLTPSEPLPFSVLAHSRVMGLVGDRFPANQQLMPDLHGDPLTLNFYPDPGANIGIPAPPHKGVYYNLIIDNDEMAVLSPFKESRNSLFQVFDKQKASWHDLHTPFPSLFVRAFGYWLAFVASDPAEGTRVPFPPGAPNSFRVVPGGYQAGSAEARKKHIVYWHDSVEDQMLTSGHNHSGKLFISNQQSGAQYEIDTGEADSEVVWVDDSRLIYRVNDQLFESAMSGSKLLAPTILATSDSVVGVHWIFKGPSTPSTQP